MGPCAKQRVVAIVTVRGHDDVIIGENVCLTPRALCPRMPGEGYAKCYTHCSSIGHAEEVALRQVRSLGLSIADITGIKVYGHSGPCDNCRGLLRAYNLLDLTEFYPEVRPAALSVGTKQAISLAYNLNEPSSHSKHAAVQQAPEQRDVGNDAQGAKGA